ncbi:MAG: SCO family protein [Caulobacterales bacterium]|nr:SCO family protein [Caulobacterales bacterium]
MAPQHPPVPPSKREGGTFATTLRRQWPVLLVAFVALLVGAALVSRSGLFSPAPPPAAVGGPFTLVDQDGKPVDEKVLNGKWSAVFFGFTYCPDVCPTTLQTLAAAADRLGPRAKDLRVVFISVDPERDTPEKMKAYVDAAHLPEGSMGLTGTVAQTDAAAKVYRVFHEKAGEGPNYLINHSTAVYLMDPKGRFVRPLAYGLTPDQTADQIKAAMQGD